MSIVMSSRSKARKTRQKQKAKEHRERLRLEMKLCKENFEKEKKLCAVLQRKCKAAHDRLLSKKSSAGPKSLTLASQTHYHVGSTVTMNQGLVDSLAIAPAMISEMEDIGEGSFGVCAKTLLHGVPVCVKTLKCEDSSSNRTKASLLHEATMLSKLRHEHICFLMGIQAIKEPYQLVMLYYTIDGVSVSIYNTFRGVHLPESKSKVVELVRPSLTVQVWLRIMKELAEALAFIHSKNIVHRDIKSDNVILYDNNRVIQCVLIDFGKSNYVGRVRQYCLSKEEKQMYHTEHKHVAPDIVDGVSTVSTSMDVYSYGRLLKNIINYFPLPLAMISVRVREGIKQCLKYKECERPMAQYMVDVFTDS